MSRRRAREAGIALLLAVWLLALLAVISAEFMASSRVRAAAESNARNDLRAWALALAGYRAAVAALDDRIVAARVDDEGRLLLHYAGTEGLPALAEGVTLGEGKYSWRILDEDGLQNVNEIQRGALASVLRACGMEPGADRDSVIDSILDWRDTNREHRLNGAEEDYYRSLDPPYSCKDSRIDVVEELLLVRGVTPELFSGGRRDGKTYPGLRDLLSTQSQVFNPATAPKALLDALGKARPARPAPPSSVFRIIATGEPGAGAPPRTIQAIVRRDDAGDSRSFKLVYWNDMVNPG